MLWWSQSPVRVPPRGFSHQPPAGPPPARRRPQLPWRPGFRRRARPVRRARDEDGGTWITAEMRAAYLRLHGLGYAHCLTVDQDGALAGGIYGVQLGGVFFGESMFSTRTDGSKSVLAMLWALAPRLGIQLLDAQVESPHLMRLGACLMPRADFQRELDRLIRTRRRAPGPRARSAGATATSET
ncbi:leucyl/phenylalanyl-tRNA--protein transferase [Alcanivorax sp. IO_7]|nr:leucyl/phenylalanyl-tRNA--protein transferase [Alcanivorax sp. IO_7]